MGRMVRKQVYIEPEQDAFLKLRARELGLTEAELIRRAIRMFSTHDETTEDRPDLAAWERIKAASEERARVVSEEPGWTWSREELYETDERFKRLLR